jgi:hypothetical protein
MDDLIADKWTRELEARIHMAYDLTRCPQTEEEFHEYFYTLIGRDYMAPATDWEAVMEAAYEWDGHMLNIPPGVGPGIRQPPDAPFFGLTQQYSGGPKGRIFLPTDTPDELGYYTRCMQYLDDAVGTYEKSKKQVSAQSTGLIWSWYWVAGAEYSPVTDAESTAPPDTGDIDALHAWMTATDARLAALEEVSAEMGQEMDDFVANGLHAHGPVDLPILLEGGPSLRAKGDINVTVKPGPATPPDMTADPINPKKLVVVLRRLFGEDNGSEP